MTFVLRQDQDRKKPALVKLERAKSIKRKWPPNGATGLVRSWVSGNMRLPSPPARTIEARAPHDRDTQLGAPSFRLDITFRSASEVNSATRCRKKATSTTSVASNPVTPPPRTRRHQGEQCGLADERMSRLAGSTQFDRKVQPQTLARGDPRRRTRDSKSPAPILGQRSARPIFERPMRFLGGLFLQLGAVFGARHPSAST